ncbi:toxin ETX/toxin MTX2 [Marininema mesophilum]|uniref:Toxin ETX/toxin MTX2 n=1 Tax=Marininema mesophilum TaxID=1048340 RepID=A0A1H2SNT0_9BACL|nr:ETX/MTX2 family pore-forming toxin [Marininema mesophilum]SDW33313.1 toxin ETX/toxin MTX2 [Marininema mesophilum]
MGKSCRRLCIFVIAFLLVASVGLTGTLNSKAFAAEPTFVDFDKVVNDGWCKATYPDTSDQCEAKVNWDNTKLNVTNVTVTKEGEPEVSTGPDMYFGTARLTNNSDDAQNLNSQEFSKQVTETLSSTVTEGFKVGTEVSLNATFMGLGTSTKLSTEYSFSNAETKTNTDTVTYTSPRQTIKVPPRTTAIVKVYLKQVNAKGKVNLNATLGTDGLLWLNHKDPDGTTAVRGWDTFDQFRYWDQKGLLPQELSVDYSGKKVLFKGSGEYSAEYGTEYQVDVSYEKPDSADGLSEKQSRSANEDKDQYKPYSYKVPVKKVKK